MYKRILLGIIAFGLVSGAALGIVSASPAMQESGEQDSFRLLVAVINDAHEKNQLSDILSDLLADVFIDGLITPHTGETNEEVRRRLVVEGPAADRAALVALYNATDGPNWEESENWMSNEPLSVWYGITTNITGRVTEIELGDNNLVGEIPAELGNLASLTNLDLHHNPLSGEIPGELGNLASLTTLHLYGNKLSGEIPPELAKLSNLERLDYTRMT